MALASAFPIRDTAMGISNRDKRALQWGAIALVLWVIIRLAAVPAWDRWQQDRAELPLRETALRKYRQSLASVDQYQGTAKSMDARLGEMESGLLKNTSPALAAAEFQDQIRQATANHAIELRSSEFLAVRPQPNGYAQLPLGLQFQCRLDQLVDFLSELRSGPKIVAIPRLQIQRSGDSAEKLISVSLTVAGVMRSQESQSNPGR